MSIQRNSPCPCGSGKKYKKCCDGKTAPADMRKIGAIVGVVLVGTTVGAGFAYYYSDLKNAAMVAAMGIIVSVGYLILRDPPNSSGRAGSDRIDFGK